MNKGYADLHLHTTASDGTLTPRELVLLAHRSGITTVSVTDHDTVAGIREAREALPDGMKLISGVEFSCFYDGDEQFLLHILGYGIDTRAESIANAVNKGREIRQKKHSLRLEYMKAVHGIEFTEEELSYFNTRFTVGKPHLAEVLVRRGMAGNIKEAIDKYMKSPDFPDGNIPASLAIEGILGAGGIPVYAHSLGGECDARLSYDEAEQRILLMKDMGIRGLECYYSRYSADDEKHLLSIAKRHGLLVSGGSDFHGKNKTVVLGELSREGVRVDCEKMSVLAIL